ncbi:cupin domain-containing protein [Chloroflexota bacterium]
MKVVNISQVEARESSNKIFKGRVSIQSLVGEGTDEFRVSQVNFSPGAVNTLHSHTFDQVLYITEGTGIVATESQETTVTPGTIIFIPAGERHWHGATGDSAFSHIAIMPPGETSF